MKKYNKIITLCLCAALAFGITACGSGLEKKEISKGDAKETSQLISKEASKEVSKEASSKISNEVSKEEPTYSNIASKESADEVKELLEAQLDKDSVENYMKQVNEYNEIVGSVGLQGDFKQFGTTEYDVEKISNLWKEKKGDFIGTNCRLNSFFLLKNNIKIPSIKSDGELLFLDNESIDK